MNSLENVLSGLRPKALEKELKISSRVDQQVPEVVNGDYVKLNQILNNLLANAIKFTERGRIELFISMSSRTNAECLLRFDVIDTGIGIDEEKIKFIFEPFHPGQHKHHTALWWHRPWVNHCEKPC
ncbi:MAG: ATP-binding protein [Cyclobacteriaceae bacterium]|nr:ATP-binding protein [Cyclobacteriaceae bacterium]